MLHSKSLAQTYCYDAGIIDKIGRGRFFYTSSKTLLILASKFQPITFGELRQATISSVPSNNCIEDKSASHQSQRQTSEDKHHQTLTTFSLEISCHWVRSPSTLKSFTKHPTNKERVHYSPSLERLFEQQNLVPPSQKRRRRKNNYKNHP